MSDSGQICRLRVEVHVTPQTELDFRGGPVAVGTVVKVEGGTVEGKYVAREIKTRRRK